MGSREDPQPPSLDVYARDMIIHSHSRHFSLTHAGRRVHTQQAGPAHGEMAVLTHSVV